MQLIDYLQLFRRKRLMIVAFVLVGLAGGIAATVTTPTVYRGQVQVFVAISDSNNPSDLQAGNTFTADRVQSYTSIATSPDVTGPVIKRLGLRITDVNLALKISADAPANKVLINLKVSDTDPVAAARLANAVAAQFVVAVQDTEQTNATGKPVVKLSVIHPAAVPSTPIAPDKALNIGLGLAVGLLVGFGVVVLRRGLDTSMTGPPDVEALGIAVLGVVPFDKRTAASPVAFHSDLHSARSEAYRQLRVHLQFVGVDHPPRVIAVTSAVSGEGKSVTSINLAVALAETGAQVCLLEADLRRPTLADSLALVGDVGLTTVLIGKAPLESVTQRAGRNLSVLTSGPVPPNPSELVVSAQARQVISGLAARYDFVIIDTAPLLPVTDGAQMATLADATIIVARAGTTSREQAKRCVEALERVGERPVGMVLNMVARSPRGFGPDDGYDGYRPEPPRAVAAKDSVPTA